MFEIRVGAFIVDDYNRHGIIVYQTGEDWYVFWVDGTELLTVTLLDPEIAYAVIG